MSYENISQKRVKTRKEHRCWGCAEMFPVGSDMDRITNVDDSGLITIYWCEICLAYWQQLKDHDSDGICMGDLLAEEDYKNFRENYKSI